MLTLSDYTRLQRIFFNNVVNCKNPVSVLIQVPTISSTGTFTDFTGDSGRDGFDTELTLKCLYKRSISDKDRAKYGIDEDIDSLVYISPLELKDKYASLTLPDAIFKTKQKAKVTLFDKVYRIKQIVENEPFLMEGTYTNISYELRLMFEK